MGCCARAVPALLLHINLLLVSSGHWAIQLYAGAGLATSARLKWDPSTYVAVREVFPREYRVAAAALPVVSIALLLLAHLSVAALRACRHAVRRVLLLTYASLMALMTCGEAALAWWLCARAAAWARSPSAAELRRALALREHLQPLLEHLSHWHPLPSKLKEIIQEAETDAPRNLHVAVAAALLLALLQAAAVLLALTAAATSPRSEPTSTNCSTDTPQSTWSTTCVESEKAPLRPPPLPPPRSPPPSPMRSPRTAYRRGRLVLA